MVRASSLLSPSLSCGRILAEGGGDSVAKIEFDGIDDLMDDLNIIEIECPNCGQEFEVSLDDLDNVMVCPHCRAKFEKT